MRALCAPAFLLAFAAAAHAAHVQFTDTAGVVTQTATTVTISGATLASPAGTVTITCPLTAVLPQYGFTQEWNCAGGSLTLRSADGATTLAATDVGGVFTMIDRDFNRIHHYTYALYATFSASQTTGGKKVAVAGGVSEALVTQGTLLTAAPGTIQAGTVDTDQQYEPLTIADTGNHRIVQASDIRGSNWTSLGTQGSGTKQFDSPWGVALDSAGRIYVSDTGNCRIVRVDDIAGDNWTSFGACGGGTGQFQSPQGLWVDASGRIYVADTGNDRIARMDDMDGTNFIAFGTHGPGTGQFAAPAAVTTDTAGHIYVADTANARVVEFADMQGAGWAAWQFPLGYLTPDGVAVDAGGRIFTTDSLQSQVLRADDISGANEASLDVNYLLYLDGVRQPSGLFVDRDGAIFIADAGNNRIDRLFDLTYTNQLVIGTAGSGAGQLASPHGAVAAFPASPVAAAAVTPASLAFPTELEGARSAPQSTVLSNIGTTAIVVTSVSSSLADFPMAHDCPTRLAPGQACTATVAFQPVAGGVRKGHVEFVLRNLPDKSVPMRGSGALVTLSPAGLVLYDGQSGEVTVTNPLGTTTSVKKVKISGNFHETDDCGPLPPGAACTITVTWVYTGFVQLGTLEVVDSAGTPQYVSITGE
jgi:streptogramin lyase